MKLYSVNAECIIIGYYGGNFVVANNKKEAIEKVRKRYKDHMIREYTARCLGNITGEVII